MKSIIPFIILAVTLTIFTLAIIYISRRFAFWFDSDSKTPYYALFGSLVVFMITGTAIFTNSVGLFGHLIYISATVTIGLMLYLLFSVAVVHLIEQFVSISPRILGISAITLTLLITSFGILNSTWIRENQVAVPISGLTENIKAVHLSDIHIGHYRGEKTMREIVQKTNKIDPDVVFITGDLMDGKYTLGNGTFKAFLDFKAPVFFVEGNHDKYTGTQKIKEKLRNAGVHVLENEMVNFKGLQLVGLNHMQADNSSFDMHAEVNGKTIASVLPELNVSKTVPSVLLHHSPDGVEYASKEGIDLYLSGHTHAGQLFPINLIAKLMYKFNKGLYDHNGTKVFVSQGIGTFGPPIRLGTQAEIVVLDLVGE